MLKKLLKYDLLKVFKFMSLFYILAMVFAIITRILFKIDNSFLIGILAQISNGVTITLMINILINTIMRLWVRFKYNLYKDESYLTHTLPVSRKELYLSKIITGIITMFVSIFVIFIVLFIAYYSKENMKVLKDFFVSFVSLYDSKVSVFLLVIFFIFFVEMANLLQVGYTGIILGHRMNQNKNLFSVVFGFITYLLTQVFVLLFLFGIAIFNSDIMNLFITEEVIPIDILKTLAILSIFVYTLSIIVCCLINIKLLKKGVNVE